MNDYGVLYYDSDVGSASATIDRTYYKAFFSNQTNSENVFVHHGLTPTNYQNWASFEQGEFDFKKPIFMPNTDGKIPYASKAVTGEDGTFYDAEDDYSPLFSLYITPTEHYSGDGFTLRTYFDEYKINVNIQDKDGVRSKEFIKTKEMQDEFFYFPFEDLEDIVISFIKIPPFHFIKIISFGFGGTRLITDENLVENPQFDHYFSLMSDELPLDTLTFRVFGNDNNFKFVTGSKITAATGEEFFVDTAQQNADNTITVNCYDALAKRDVAFSGMMRTNTDVRDSTVVKALFDDLEVFFDQTTSSFRLLTWAGTVSDDVTYREAIRMWLQGCTLSLKRYGPWYLITSPFNDIETAKVFNKTDIISIDFKALERYTRIHFSKHKYTVDKKNGLQEAFRDTVEIYDPETDNIQTLSFGEPYSGVLFYYVSAQSGDDETLTIVDPNYFVISQTGAYLVKAKNINYYQEIVAKGYPYKTSYTSIDYYPQISKQFKDNELMISDCTVALNVSNSAYRRRLEFYAKFDTIITLQSLKNYWAGDKVRVSIDGKTYEGFITHKTDTMAGVYDYEILGYEVIEDVA